MTRIDRHRYDRINMSNRTDYTLQDVLTGKQSERTRRKRWWMRKILGPDGRRYSRMLFDLPPLEGDE